MRIAVTYEDGQVFQHFGHTERFKVYDVEDGEVTLAAVVNTDGSGHGALADILKKIHVDTLICGGIGVVIFIFGDCAQAAGDRQTSAPHSKPGTSARLCLSIMVSSRLFASRTWFA